MATQAEIEALYKNILDRNADKGGLEFYLNSGKSLADIEAEMYASKENVEQDIAQAYQSELGRDYDQAGFDYWVNRATSSGEDKLTLDEVLGRINVSEEGRIMDPTEVLREGLYSGYQDYNLNPQTAQDLVTAAYWSELGRAPDAGGLEYYTNLLLNDKGQSMGSVLQDISRSAEGRTYDDTGYVFGGLEGLTNEQILAGVQPYTDVYGNLPLFSNRTAGYDAGYHMGDSPWTVEMRDEFGNPSQYYLNPEAVTETGALPGFGYEWSTADGSVDSNYGMYGKRPDETLTQYYERLATERQGGILGQGLLSASPTVGSESWNALQTVEDIIGDKSVSNALANTYYGNDSGVPSFAIDYGNLTPLNAYMLQQDPIRKGMAGLFSAIGGPLGAAATYYDRDQLQKVIEAGGSLDAATLNEYIKAQEGVGYDTGGSSGNTVSYTRNDGSNYYTGSSPTNSYGQTAGDIENASGGAG